MNGLGQIFSAVSGTQIDAYNFETLLLANEQIGRLIAQIKEVRCQAAGTGQTLADGAACGDVGGGLVHIALSDVDDPVVRRRLQDIPTGLTIPDADVDLLLYWGERLVRENSTIRSIISNANPEIAMRRPESYEIGQPVSR